MSLASEALHYRKGGVTYDVPLYTEESDGGPERLAVRVGGNTRYVTLPPVGDARATDLRVHRSGVIRSIGGHAVAYKPTWELIGSSGLTWIKPSPYTTGTYNSFLTEIPDIAFDHEVIYSVDSPYNLRFVWQSVSGANKNYAASAAAGVLGNWFTGGSLAIGSTRYVRAPTGVFSLQLYLEELFGTDANFYAGGVTAYRVAP